MTTSGVKSVAFGCFRMEIVLMEKLTRIYQCEDSVNGILSAVYDAGVSGYGHKYIRIQPVTTESVYNIEMFAEYIKVDTSGKKAESVLNAVRAKISYEAYYFVMSVVLADDVSRGDVIYQFVTYGFTIGRDITKALQLDCVIQMFNIKRNVQNEAHKFLEFLRFQEIRKSPSVLFAKMEPNNRILTIVTSHFEDRFNAEYFIIYDKRHGEASFHSPDGRCEIRILTEEEEKKFDELLNLDEKYVDLWKVFFETIAVEERKNSNLQRNNLAIRYRKHMTEFIDNDSYNDS